MARNRPENAELLRRFCPDPDVLDGPTGPLWFDKTPGEEIIEIAPRLLELFPSARFVLMKRRGVDNVLSACRKFGTQWFDSRCQNWARAMQAWLSVRDQLGPAGLELDHATLRTDPAGAVRALGAFLELDERQIEWAAEAFETLHPEQTADDTTPVCTPIQETAWTPEQQSAFEQICGPMMREYGYSP
jgi:hypothetical protein